MTTISMRKTASTMSQTRRILQGVLLSLSVAAFSGIAASAAAADDTADAGRSAAHDRDKDHAHRGPKDPSRLLKRFDKNQDGKLAVGELPERLREHLGTADTNKDGFLSVDELRAGKALHERKRFAAMDKDGNGVLTASEVGEKRWAHLKAADANGDGKLTADELRAAHAARKLHGGHRRPEHRNERGGTSTAA